MSTRIALLALFVASFLAPALVEAGGPCPWPKVAICHVHPAKPGNAQTLCISPTALQGHLAHGDHRSFEGACYVFVAEIAEFAEAEQACKERYGGNLTSIHNNAEDAFVSALVDPDSVGGITAIIGGRRAFFCNPGIGWEGAWTDLSPWDFQNWRGGEPTCLEGDCIQFWPNTNGALSGWNDVRCNAKLGGFVCKYRP